ncbi:isochorismatase domain-containing protein 2 [Conidiobolus coronatus NRRL 28638]|uniref:Isochorismatase domain-containing protein 2 n=1 Tax=Conidiobolus coronatus (strain ATCC 28846 / CBS 209.66 / NRRL 28638) TaxID=796925 RepID=A0A137PDH3_CONC2|nr:isochorismatase domain-containing protein 2 [Conidiobolus coronatus NRRL 28638]|eukprot:KXN73058.1 isochorismatase domain-containing protein 2 [Conidiobolus coronatus NRRL 28638]
MSQAIRKVSQLQLNKTSFFLCDIQEKFQNLIFGYNNVVRIANKMVKASQVLDIPLIVTEQYPKGLGHTSGKLDISKAKHVSEKTLFSMVTPQVEEQIKDVKSVILFGIEAHVCVTQTALDLLERNIDVFILADGVSSTNKFEVPIALQRLSSAGATITTSDSILFQLVKDANHPNFKEISNLVKEHLAKTEEDNLLLKNLSSSL